MSPAVTISGLAATLPPPPRYSHHKLSTYATCPNLYRRLYIDHIKSEDSDASALGSYIHRKIAEHLSAGAPLVNDYAGRPDDYHRAEAMFASLAERLALLKETAGFNVIAAEHEFEIPLDADRGGRRHLRGRIDLVAEAYGQKVVVDWKSGRVLPTRSEVEDDLQLYLYALAVPDAVEVWLWNLEHDVVVRVPVDRARVDEARRYSIAVAETIEADRAWRRRPNPLCASCQFVRECFKATVKRPVKAEKGALVVPSAKPLTPATAAKVWADIETVKAHLKVWERRIDAARAALEVFVDANGPVPLGEGRVLDLRTKQRRRYPLNDAFRVMGDDLKACVTVQNGLVEKRLKAIKETEPDRARDLEQALGAIVEVETTTELAAMRADAARAAKTSPAGDRPTVTQPAAALPAKPRRTSRKEATHE